MLTFFIQNTIAHFYTAGSIVLTSSQSTRGNQPADTIGNKAPAIKRINYVLTACFLFLIGLTEGSGGFPDIWLEDRIFQVIKKANHDLLMEEERRLFYVAITRAKEKLFLITEKGSE